MVRWTTCVFEINCMALWIPTNYELPASVGNIWERAVVHNILLGSIMYYSDFVTEDDGVNRPLCQYYMFRALTGEMRFGFRGSIEIDPLYAAGLAEEKAFWEYVKQRSTPTIPTAFFDPV